MRVKTFTGDQIYSDGHLGQLLRNADGDHMHIRQWEGAHVFLCFCKLRSDPKFCMSITELCRGRSGVDGLQKQTGERQKGGIKETGSSCTDRRPLDTSWPGLTSHGSNLDRHPVSFNKCGVSTTVWCVVDEFAMHSPFPANSTCARPAMPITEYTGLYTQAPPELRHPVTSPNTLHIRRSGRRFQYLVNQLFLVTERKQHAM